MQGGPDASRRELDEAFAGLAVEALVGPTAVGKSALALELAERLDAELLSLDSMQVYRGLDVGTAKPSAAERARVRHHLLDLVGPEERYDVTRWLADAARAVREVRARGKRALFVGGTGFWLVALLRGLFEGPPVDEAVRARFERRYVEEGPERLHAELARRDPPSAARIHAHDRKRLVRALEVHEQSGRPLSHWQREWGWHESGVAALRAHRVLRLECAREELGARIEARARAMLAAGWVEEARAIRAGPGFGPTSAQALGYAEVLELADGRLEREAALARIVQRTRRFARKQLGWYRKLEQVETRSAPRDASALARLADELALRWRSPR